MTNLNKSLASKVALITGGSRGIGRAIAAKLAEDGAIVAINYAENDVAALETLREIQEKGGKGFLIKAVLGKDDSAENIRDALISELDGMGLPHSLDILINNAGMGFFSKFSYSTIQKFDELFAVNVRGIFHLAQTVLPLLSDGGRIINLSSGLSKRPLNQTSVYSMSKAAVDSFTIALAKELGERQITVNAVGPGWTVTDMNEAALEDEGLKGFVTSGTPLGRIGKPNDIANVVGWLSSAKASWLTGQWLEASGGFGL
mgnify:FL=1